MPFWMLGQDWHGVNTAPKNALPLKIVYQLQIFNSPPFANMVWPCLAMLPRTLFWICADTLVALLSASEEAGWSLYVFFGFFALSFSRSPQKDANKNSGSKIEYSWTAPLLHLLVLYLSLFVIIFWRKQLFRKHQFPVWMELLESLTQDWCELNSLIPMGPHHWLFVYNISPSIFRI